MRILTRHRGPSGRLGGLSEPGRRAGVAGQLCFPTHTLRKSEFVQRVTGEPPERGLGFADAREVSVCSQC